MGYQRTLEQELDDKASLIFLPGDRITSFQSLKSTLLRPSDAHFMFDTLGHIMPKSHHFHIDIEVHVHLH